MADFRVVTFRDKLGDWRWRVLADNNRSVAVSGEGYANKGDLDDIVERLFGGHPDVEVEEK